MNFFEKIVYFLDSKMIEPQLYGWFHLLFFAITILAIILICVKFKNCSSKTFKRFILTVWIIMLILELYKQLVFSFSYSEGVANWDYMWYAFPLQLCSSPLYILPIIIFCKRQNVKDSAMAFMSTFSLFGGLLVMFYPGDVFVETIGVNFQTMIHHGLQVVVGIFCMVYNRKRLNYKFLLKGFITWGIYLAVVVLCNTIMPLIVNETFNMMYISPYANSEMPVVSKIYSALPYPLFLILYITCFTLAGTIIFYIQYYLIKYFKNKSTKRKG